MAGDPTVSHDGPGYRDTATGLGRLIPRPEPDCTNPTCRDRHRLLHRLADCIDVYRDADDNKTAEIAALTAEVNRLRNRYERPA